MGADQRQLGMGQPPGGRAGDHDRAGGVPARVPPPGRRPEPVHDDASCLDSGLRGIADRIEPPPMPSVGPAFADASIPHFPATLDEAADALDGSKLARKWYGDLYIDHYVASRRAEADIVRGIANAQVPEYEVARYFEIADDRPDRQRRPRHRARPAASARGGAADGGARCRVAGLDLRRATRSWRCTGDVTRADDLEAAVAAVEERFGGLDVFVSNAGLFLAGGGDGPSPRLSRGRVAADARRQPEVGLPRRPVRHPGDAAARRRRDRQRRLGGRAAGRLRRVRRLHRGQGRRPRDHAHAGGRARAGDPRERRSRRARSPRR